MPRLRFQPGIIADDPAFTSDPRWIDGNNVRFRLGRPETIGLWRKILATPLEGRPSEIQDALSEIAVGPSFEERPSRPFFVVGTHQWLYRLTYTLGAGNVLVWSAEKIENFTQTVPTNGYSDQPYTTYDSEGRLKRATVWTMQQAGKSVVAHVPNRLCLVTEFVADVISQATLLPTAAGAFVTDDDFLVYLGHHRAQTGQDPQHFWRWTPRTVIWSDQGNFENLIPGETSLAGSFELKDGGALIGGGTTSRGILLWTDSAVYEMQPLNDAEFVFSFPNVGRMCGLAGPNAWADADGQVFWLSPAGAVHVYDGGGVTEIPCPVRSKTLDLIVPLQRYIIHATTDVSRSEVTWFLPCGTAGNEIDRYLTLNYAEKSWSYGMTARTCAIDRHLFDKPFMVGPDGHVYEHELAPDVANVEARAWSLTSAGFDGGNPEITTRMTRIVPDHIMEGPDDPTFTIQVKGRDWPSETYPFTQRAIVHQKSERADIRAEGRQLQIVLGGSGKTFHRLGDFLLWLEPGDGR